ncbi:MAG: aldehyde dehydrogenase (NADP(+)) [Tetrasphaera jenkinsii]|nr:aldehyde dehydrogenase (NADP(+)) [Tetrasphaera jenkinsii]
MPLTGELLIDGHGVAGTGAVFTAVDPATGTDLAPEFRDAGPDQIAAATAAAAAAAGRYSALPRAARADFLDAIADRIEGLGDQLIERAHAETGLSTARLTGERGRTCTQLRLFAKVVRAGDYLGVRVDPAQPDRTPLPRPDLRLRRVPIGPVAVFGASNFPLAFSVAGGDTAAALAAGCPVVVKAHPAHPGTSELVARAIVAAAESSGMPPGVFGMLVGRGNEVGSALVGDPAIAAVAFTGSRAGGLALVALAAERPVPIPVYAEMSATNPVVVLPGAIAESEAAGSLATAYVESLTRDGGQYCTNPGLMLLPAGAAGDAFLDAVGARLAAATGAAMLTPAISAAYVSGRERWSGVPEVEVVGDGRPGEGPNSPAPAVRGTTAARYLAHPELADEVFGPAGLVVRYADTGELVGVVDSLDGQLTATIQGTEDDHDAAAEVLPHLEAKAGRILWGGWPTGVEVTHAMVHGGPFPATSAPATTSVGTLAIDRFTRPVSYQSFPDALLPAELQAANPDGVGRRVDGVLETPSA